MTAVAVVSSYPPPLGLGEPSGVGYGGTTGAAGPDGHEATRPRFVLSEQLPASDTCCTIRKRSRPMTDQFSILRSVAEQRVRDAQVALIDAQKLLDAASKRFADARRREERAWSAYRELVAEDEVAAS